jgi:hypothetical protein
VVHITACHWMLQSYVGNKSLLHQPTINSHFSPPPQVAQQSLVDQGLLIIQASRSESQTLRSVGLLWTSNQSTAETSTCTTHNIRYRQTSMLLAVFEPTIPANERPRTHALDCAAAGIGILHFISATLLQESYCNVQPR